ncbi:exodeoxyribonuclease VII small subunit [Rubinisphaera sp. JC750]|uniref:exodeoxyribonuclease VII small subunit n=1 Tax=Rubinisphaera sp. JC750 TaxID=2898658 RepID=UPI001F01D034|nr:exodeoxyribonuclease VII small subunit [Rubinisphaera sp. JC750]
MAPKKKPAKTDQPGFEESLEQLQTIVQQLEDGSLGLEEALLQYEQGTSLLRRCYQILQTAEQKIELLTGMDAEGNPECEPFDGSATLQQREQTAGRRKQGGGKEPAAEKNKPSLFGEADD